jgi:predicted phosphodiesterase/biotin operon repressor
LSITKEQYYELLAKHGSQRKVAKVTGIPKTTLRRIVEKFDVKEPVYMQDAILKAMRNVITIKELCKRLGLTERVLRACLDDIKKQGYDIEEVGNTISLAKMTLETNNEILNNWRGEKVIRFGVIADTHFNSIYQQITHLNHFYDICEREGIKTIYHAGDIDEGEEMRPGHKYECFNQGADEHTNYIVENYPIRKNIVTKFITGNHDHSMIKRCGFNIGKAISSRRPDLEYIGQDYARVYLTHNCRMDIQHPGDGAAYALSYSIQRTIESLASGDKPNILVFGHHHKAIYLMYRNIHGIEAGTFQAQTPFMRGKRLAAQVGGWIVEVHVDDEGSITRFKPEFIPCYKMIEHDY